MFRYSQFPSVSKITSMVRTLALVLVALALPATAAATPPPQREHGHATCESGDWKPNAILRPISPDGVNFLAIKQLAVTMPDAARTSILRGLNVCDPTAAQAIAVTKMESVLPQLVDLLEPKNNFYGGEVVPSPRYSPFRVQVVIALNAMHPLIDYSPYLVPLLADADPDVRLHAAMGARNFRAGLARGELLRAVIDRVRRDDDPLVRRHA